MWIAKPVAALSEAELRSFPVDVPLAQSLAWARAIESLGSKTYAIFDPGNGVGGIVYESSTGQFECVNGPILHWDDSTKIAAQLSTFVMAATKLSKNFRGLTLRPRWLESQLEERLSKLPIEATRIDRASTWIVPVAPTQEEQLAQSTERLRRTFRRAEALTRVRVESWDPSPVSEALDRFVEAVSQNGREKSFSVPPANWFRSLIESDQENFLSIRAESFFSKTDLMVAIRGSAAHYLFGVTRRKADAPSSERASRDSTSTIAHFKALEELRRLGIREYDLNGFVADVTPEHPYFGVAQYKKQFGGSPVDYVQAVFEIKAGE